MIYARYTKKNNTFKSGGNMYLFFSFYKAEEICKGKDENQRLVLSKLKQCFVKLDVMFCQS